MITENNQKIKTSKTKKKLQNRKITTTFFLKKNNIFHLSLTSW